MGANENALSSGQIAAKKAAGPLLAQPRRRKGSMPDHQVLKMKRIVAKELVIEVDDIVTEHLEKVFHLGEGPRPSERICHAACADPASLRCFPKTWRDLFVSSLHPKFLAEGWGVDTGLDDG